MRDIFPETFDPVSYDNLEEAVKKIEDRIRYSEECLDHAIKNTTKAVEKGGASPAEIVMRLYDLEGSLSDLSQSVRSLTASLTRVSQQVSNAEIKTGRIPPLVTTVGAVGQLYVDLITEYLYCCVSNTNNYYIWHKIN